MAAKITNRAGRLLLIQLNSGVTLYLAPGESSEPVDDYELEKNEHVRKLLEGDLIEWADAGRGPEARTDEGAPGGR